MPADHDVPAGLTVEAPAREDTRGLALAVKRAADVLLAVTGLVLLGPLILFLALLVKLTSPGPAIFRQRRLGQYGKPFVMYKLRTMVDGAEGKGAGLAIEENDSRITRFGRFLRNTSLDELPQLWNILRGDMSFVGPRPLFEVYLDRWTQRQKKRLLMPQGLTGWAQTRGRNDVPWDERLEMDVWYVENWSLLLDVRILLETFSAVIARRGVFARDGKVPELGKETAGDET
ncbi:MAG: sugar transferase [Armatimonadetes bacterium]|nr:sugar transferase [Armatimonadota bacterium]